MNQIGEILIQRLGKKGILSKAIAGLIRDLENNIFTYPNITLQELNNRLSWLGWTDFELDNYTLQLIIAMLESGKLMGRYYNGKNQLETNIYLNS